jgi:hypothetical protein
LVDVARLVNSSAGHRARLDGADRGERALVLLVEQHVYEGG